MTHHAAHARRVNVHDADKLKYWSERFDVSKESIRQAVEKVGNALEARGRSATMLWEWLDSCLSSDAG